MFFCAGAISVCPHWMYVKYKYVAKVWYINLKMGV